jgi:hypothetical protein
MKLICRNKDCTNFGIEEEFTHSVYVMVDGHLQSVNAECPCCGEIREEINDAENIPIDEKNIEYGKYSSASMEDKQKILKKRSHEHYLREVKPYKEHKINEAVTTFNSVK